MYKMNRNVHFNIAYYNLSGYNMFGGIILHAYNL